MKRFVVFLLLIGNLSFAHEVRRTLEWEVRYFDRQILFLESSARERRARIDRLRQHEQETSKTVTMTEKKLREAFERRVPRNDIQINELRQELSEAHQRLQDLLRSRRQEMEELFLVETELVKNCAEVSKVLDLLERVEVKGECALWE